MGFMWLCNALTNSSFNKYFKLLHFFVLGVMPNVETKVLLVQIFGEKSHPIRKYQRLLYWFPRFKHTNPYPVPHQLPEDPVDLARLSLKRIADDLDAKVTIYQVELLLFVFGQNMPVFLNVTI